MAFWVKNSGQIWSFRRSKSACKSVTMQCTDNRSFKNIRETGFFNFCFDFFRISGIIFRFQSVTPTKIIPSNRRAGWFFFKKFREIEDTGQLLYPGHSKIGIGDEVFGNDVFSNDVFFLGIGDDIFFLGIEISDTCGFSSPRIVRQVL